MKPLKSIRSKLFFWYATSLVSITAFFYLAVHIFALPYGNLLFLILLIALALEGLFIIRKMTNGLLKLSSKIKTITSKNLNEKMALGMVFYFYCTVMPSEEEPIQELKIVSKYVHIREETEKLKV